MSIPIKSIAARIEYREESARCAIFWIGDYKQKPALQLKAYASLREQLDYLIQEAKRRLKRSDRKS